MRIPRNHTQLAISSTFAVPRPIFTLLGSLRWIPVLPLWCDMFREEAGHLASVAMYNSDLLGRGNMFDSLQYGWQQTFYKISFRRRHHLLADQYYVGQWGTLAETGFSFHLRPPHSRVDSGMPGPTLTLSPFVPTLKRIPQVRHSVKDLHHDVVMVSRVGTAENVTT